MAKKEEYRYYSTQRPVSIGTFPEPPGNGPTAIKNYDSRIPVEGGAFRAWGELTYEKPLTEKEASDYELRPCRENLDVRRAVDAQAQIVGKWEDTKRVPEQKRLTWFYPDFGSYVAKEFVTPERLAECVRGIVAQQAARTRREGKEPPIAEQLKQAAKLAGENRAQPTPKKDAPDHGDR